MTTPLRRFGSVSEGLTFEAGLFSAQGPQVGLWTADANALVCPRAYETRNGFAQAASLSSTRGWPVHVRPTGGGTVPQGRGVANLALSFDAPEGFTIEDGYRLLTRIFRAGLRVETLDIGNTPGSFCDGDWNLSINGRKLVGTAQRWRPTHHGRPRVLAHAMVLVSGDIASGADSVSAFHRDLGLSPVKADVHTSLCSATHHTDLPAKNLLAAARGELAHLLNPMNFSTKETNHVHRHHPHPS